LEPVVARYRGTVKRLYFRGDAAFANPEIYEFLEAEAIGHNSRITTCATSRPSAWYDLEGRLSTPVAVPLSHLERLFIPHSGHWSTRVWCLKRGAAIIRDEGERRHSPGQCQPVAHSHSSRQSRLAQRVEPGLQNGLAPGQPFDAELGIETASFGQSAVASDPEEDRSLCHPLGAPQVQAVASEAQGGTRLV
jgi:hypothetical protein